MDAFGLEAHSRLISPYDEGEVSQFCDFELQLRASRD